MKFAYLIIAHNEPKLFKALIKAIDYINTDIFVHIDSKTNIENFCEVKTKFSKIYFLENRVDVRWGDFSLAEAELRLFQRAHDEGPYDYYHLISGVDFPIKTQEFIQKELMKNPHIEYVGFSQGVNNENDLKKRINYYHIFTKELKSKTTSGVIKRKISNLFLIIQKVFGFKRKYNFIIKKGPNWASITNNFCEYILSHKAFIHANFKYIPCVDEIFLQTVIWNSPFRRNIKNIKEENGSCMREIDWERGLPYIWGKESIDNDIEIIKHSKHWFARKFSIKYPKIIHEIQNTIK